MTPWFSRARHACAVALALFLAVPLAAQSVPQQWIFPGLYGQDLVDALRAEYTPPSTLGYNLARDVLFQWEQDQTGHLRCVYTGYTITLTPGADPSTSAYNQGINTEHTWPQSMGAGTEPARSDMHHLFPSKDNVNSSRGNHPYGEVPDAQTDGWYRLTASQSTIPSTAIDEWSEKDNDHPNPSYTGRFEPREDHAGNAARAVFYFWTIYSAQSNAAFFDVQQADLIDWHEQDTVDLFEAQRNSFIASYQGGKVNPFVLDTTLVRRAYGIGWIPGDPGEGDPPTGDPVVWINEIHYDNSGADTNEGFEIAGTAGTNLAGWSVVLYNGSGGASYDTVALSGAIDDEQNGFGALWFAAVGMQNGAPDGLALVDDTGTVVQFLSYEGVMTASNGAASGQSSTDIGVSETTSTPVGHALQLTGTGSAYADFTWSGPAAHSRGALNAGQTLEGGPPAAPVAWINEIHYDNSSTDTNEGIEIAGTAGLDLAGWSLVAYNGSGGASYSTTGLSGTLPNQEDGLGTLWFAIAGLQNGAPDGVALVDGTGAVVQFLSYEGSFTASGGPASGLTSTDIGVSETASTPVGYALQLTGTGTVYADFTWSGPSAHSRGAANTGQTFGAPRAPTATEPAAVPGDFALSAAYPNPFNPSTAFALTLGTADRVTVAAYDVLGRRVALLHDGALAAGTHAFRFEARDLPSGTYLLRAVSVRSGVATRRVTLLK